MEANVHCKNCGNSNPPGSKFCNQCASQLSSPFCANCGNKNPSEAVFCNQCGSKLGVLNMVKPLAKNESTPKSTSKIDPPLSSSTTAGQNATKLLSENFYEDSYGIVHVVGELQNISANRLRFVIVTASFYSSQNNIIGTRSSLTNPSVVEAGSIATYDIMVSKHDLATSPVASIKTVCEWQVES